MLKRHYTIIKMNKLTKIIFITFISLILLFFKTVAASEKIKIGLLVPMSGKNKDLGQSITVSYTHLTLPTTTSV